MTDPQNPDSSWIVELSKAAAAMIAGLMGGAYWKRSRVSKIADYPVGWQAFLNEIRRELREIRNEQGRQAAEYEIHTGRLNDLEVAIDEHTRVLIRVESGLRTAGTRPPNTPPSQP